MGINCNTTLAKFPKNAQTLSSNNLCVRPNVYSPTVCMCVYVFQLSVPVGESELPIVRRKMANKPTVHGSSLWCSTAKKTKTFSLVLLKLSLISPVGNTCDKTRNGWGSTRITQTSSAREAGFCAVCVLKFTLWSAASRRKRQDSCSPKERKLLERQPGPCNVCVFVRGRARCRQGSRPFPGQTYRAGLFLGRHAGQAFAWADTPHTRWAL